MKAVQKNVTLSKIEIPVDVPVMVVLSTELV